MLALVALRRRCRDGGEILSVNVMSLASSSPPAMRSLSVGLLLCQAWHAAIGGKRGIRLLYVWRASERHGRSHDVQQSSLAVILVWRPRSGSRWSFWLRLRRPAVRGDDWIERRLRLAARRIVDQLVLVLSRLRPARWPQ